MSRGPGVLQRAIRARVAAGAVQSNQLCWELAQQLGSQGTSPAGVTRPFYGSFRRALGSDVTLRVSMRRLLDLDELQKYYPFKTRESVLKHARELLLPVFCKCLVDSKDRQFSVAQNEDYLFPMLPQNARREVGNSWEKIEPELIRAMHAHLHARDQWDRLLDLLVRGRELFSPFESSMSHARAFGKILSEAEELSGPLPVLLAARKLYSHALPKNELRRTALKSQLFAVLDMRARGPSRMKDEGKAMLLREAPKVVRALPDHVDGLGQGWDHVPTRFSPVLDRLIGRDALGPFEFVSLAVQS